MTILDLFHTYRGRGVSVLGSVDRCATAYGLTINAARRKIAKGQTWLICARCWHVIPRVEVATKYGCCAPCREWRRASGKARLSFAEPYRRRFMTPDEVKAFALRVLHMTAAEYEASREDRLVYARRSYR